jgi:L-ribulose-5-phosphate 3-epimerase
MNDLKISVFSTILSEDLTEAAAKAVDLGLPGLHLSTYGRYHPDNLDAQARRDLVKMLHATGVEISALSYWGGEVDLCDRAQHAAAIPEGRKQMQLAVDLECRKWQGHVGIVPWETQNPRWQAIVDGTSELVAYGAEVGAVLLLETGPEPPRIFRRLLETVNSPGLGINFDPANLILWPPRVAQEMGVPFTRAWAMEHFDPMEGATILGPWVGHTHAKDALVQPDGKPLEVPLGEGWVDWPVYVKNLKAAGFEGYYAIEREVGTDKLGDTMKAVEFLRGLEV